jgi:hypothetical protein
MTDKNEIEIIDYVRKNKELSSKEIYEGISKPTFSCEISIFNLFP